MFCKTEQDQGLIQIPVVTPHIDIVAFDDADLGLTEEATEEQRGKINFAFYVDSQGNGQGLQGTLARDVLRLADGARSREDIAAELRARGYEALKINTMLVNLAYRFLLVSAEHSLPPERAALFSSLGITPRRAQDELAKLKLHIHSVAATGGADLIAECARALGIAAPVEDEGDADVVIVAVDDYLQPELPALNREYRERAQQWLPLKISGIEGMAGPLFNLADNPFCLECVRTNLRNSREYRGFLGHNKAGAEVASERVFEESIARGRAANALIQLLIARLFADQPAAREARGGVMVGIGENLLSNNSIDAASAWHHIIHRPQCACCGDPQLRDNARPPAPVDVLGDGGESVFTSGGMKARSPLQTWNKYQRLISPLTGVVTGVVRSSPADDSWLHVYWAGSNLAIVNKNFLSLSNSLRTKSAGKGRSEMQAKVSALCEALERYSGVYDGSEIHRRAKFADFAEGEALRPNDVMLFSDKQYAMRGEVAAKGHRFYRLPEADFDEQAEVEWTPLWSLSRERFVWMLSVQAYYSYFAEEMALNKFMGNPDSNGAASGNTLAEAFVQGFMELVERDAYAIWWYNRLAYPRVDLAAFADPFIDQLVARYQSEYRRSVWVLDITHDFGIPVFVAVSERIDKTKRDICVSAGAHFDPHIALLRALCELNQYASAVLHSTDEPASYSYFDPECLHWWQNATLKSDPYLLPDRAATPTTPATYPLIERTQAEEAQACIDAAHAKGIELLVMDQTKPEVGLPVIKIVAPGMRHFWARFAPGRLYDVPLAMGKLDAPTAEEDLNPTPVFI